jgi:hypothetical protein
VQPVDGRQFCRQTMEMVNQANVLIGRLWADSVDYVTFAEKTPLLIPKSLVVSLRDLRDALKDAFDSGGEIIGDCRTVISATAPATRNDRPLEAVDDDDYGPDGEPTGAVNPDDFDEDE